MNQPMRAIVPDDAWPALVDMLPSPGSQRLLANWAGKLGKTVFDDGPGAVVIVGLVAVPEPIWTQVFMRVCRALGEPLPQDEGGTLVRVVTDRGGSLADARRRYSDTRFGGNFHTDGVAFEPDLPDLFSLLCMRQAAIGGELVLVPSEEIVAQLQSNSGETLSALAEDYCFDRRDAGTTAQVGRGPILRRSEDGRWELRYLRAYVDSGHARPDCPPLSAEQRRAIDTLDGVLAEASCQTTIRLEPSEVVVVDNRRYLHGRREFTDCSGVAPRLLKRIWLRRLPKHALGG